MSLDSQSIARPEQPDQGAPDQPAKIAHRTSYRPIRGLQSAVWSFAVATTPVDVGWNAPIGQQYRPFADSKLAR
jgi:hypothetical protein